MSHLAERNHVIQRRPASTVRRPQSFVAQSIQTMSPPQRRNDAPVASRVTSPVSHRIYAQPEAKSSNGGGLPQRLRAGVESLSGLAMDDVRVHRNSAEPAKIGALAFTRGAEIHLGPGQEQHLPHEAWHVVQQKQGRVQATAQMKGASLNADGRLEAEADRMGQLATGMPALQGPPDNLFRRAGGASVVQRQAAEPSAGDLEVAQLLKEVGERLKQPDYPDRERDLAIRDALLAVSQSESSVEPPASVRPAVAVDALAYTIDERAAYGERVMAELERQERERKSEEAKQEQAGIDASENDLAGLRAVLAKRRSYNRFDVTALLTRPGFHPRALAILRHYGLEWPRRGPTQASVEKALDKYEHDQRKKTTGSAPVLSGLTEEDAAAIDERERKARILDAQREGYGATINSFLGAVAGGVARWFTDDEEKIAGVAQIGANMPAIVPGQRRPVSRPRSPARKPPRPPRYKRPARPVRAAAKPKAKVTGPDFSDVSSALNKVITTLDRLKRDLRSKNRAVKQAAKAEKRELEKQKRQGSVPADVPLVPGRSILKEFHIDRYGSFSNRPGDKLAGHEMLQNAWIAANVKGAARGKGDASRSNPAVALSRKLHKAVGQEQRKLGLFSTSKLKKMTYRENIEQNAQAMRNAGVPEDVIQVLKGEAIKHGAAL